MSRTLVVASLPKHNHDHDGWFQLPLWNGQWDVTKFLLRLWVQDSNFVGAPWLLPSPSGSPLPPGILDAFRNLLVSPWPSLEPGSNFRFRHHRQRQRLIIDLFDLLVARGLDVNQIYAQQVDPDRPGVPWEPLGRNTGPCDTSAASEVGLLHITAARSSSRELGPLLCHMLSKSVDVNLVNRVGLTPLHVAVYHGQMNAVRLLIAAGASLELKWRTGPLEATPLDLAIQTFQTQKGRRNVYDDGDSEVEYLLLNAGAEVKLRHVLASIEVGNLRFASELLQHWSPENEGNGEDVKSQHRLRPRLSYNDLNLGISFFKTRGHEFRELKTFIRHCLAHGMRVCDDFNRTTGNSLLHDSIKYGHTDLYTWVVTKFMPRERLGGSALATSLTASGYSPLHLAIKYSSPALPRILLYSWTSELTPTPTGLGLLHLAVCSQNWDAVISLLAKFGADSSTAPLSGVLREIKLGFDYTKLEYLLRRKINVEIQDWKGHVNQAVAGVDAGNESDDVKSQIQDQIKTKLIHKFKDREDSPPGIGEATYEVLQEVLGSSEMTPLQIAFATGNVAIVETLLEAGAASGSGGNELAEFNLSVLNGDPRLVLTALENCVPRNRDARARGLANAQILGIPSMTVFAKYVSIHNEESASQVGQIFQKVYRRGYDFWIPAEPSDRAPFLIHLLVKRNAHVVRLLHRPDLPPLNPNVKCVNGQDLVSFLLTAKPYIRPNQNRRPIAWLLRNCFDATVIRELPGYKFSPDDLELLRLILQSGGRFRDFRSNCQPQRSIRSFENFCDEVEEANQITAVHSLSHLCRIAVRKLPECNLVLSLDHELLTILSAIKSFIRFEDLNPAPDPRQLEAEEALFKSPVADLERSRAEKKSMFMRRAEVEFRREAKEEDTNNDRIVRKLEAWSSWSSAMSLAKNLG